VTRNITLAIDDDLLDKVRVLAAMKRTSVNEMVRGFLTQLAEFYVNAQRKVSTPLTADEAKEWVLRLSKKAFQPVDFHVIRAGIETSRRYRISYCDGAIIAAAERIGAKVLYSEDLSHGQTYGSVRVENPFKDI